MPIWHVYVTYPVLFIIGVLALADEAYGFMHFLAEPPPFYQSFPTPLFYGHVSFLVQYLWFIN